MVSYYIKAVNLNNIYLLYQINNKFIQILTSKLSFVFMVYYRVYFRLLSENKLVYNYYFGF